MLAKCSSFSTTNPILLSMAKEILCILKVTQNNHPRRRTINVRIREVFNPEDKEHVGKGNPLIQKFFYPAKFEDGKLVQTSLPTIQLDPGTEYCALVAVSSEVIVKMAVSVSKSTRGEIKKLRDAYTLAAGS